MEIVRRLTTGTRDAGSEPVTVWEQAMVQLGWTALAQPATVPMHMTNTAADQGVSTVVG